MGATKGWRTEAISLFQATKDHPFVQGIGSGTLKKEQLIHYVSQDYEYLNTYMRVYGIAISKCDKREDIALFHERISFILRDETHPHHNFCRVAGVELDQLHIKRLAPSAHHYTCHLLSVAQQGTIGEIMSVLLPCLWIYVEIGQHLVNSVHPDQNHPFYNWIMFYADPAMSAYLETCLKRIDEWAENASDKEAQKMKEHFILGCHLENVFFDMAYNLEGWPLHID